MSNVTHPMWHTLYFGREVVKRVLGVSIIQVVWKKRTYPDPALKVVSRQELYFALGRSFASLALAEKYVRDHPPVKGGGTIPLP